MSTDQITDSIIESAKDSWTRFERATPTNVPPKILKLHAQCAPSDKFELYKNNRYQVALYRDVAPLDGAWPVMIHLSIKRIDREPVRDWRDMQRIKNELVGLEHEAVELFPAESRLVDSANQYHLFVLATPGVKFPFGFTSRFVSEEESDGSKQRPFSPDMRPADLSTLDEYARKAGIKI